MKKAKSIKGNELKSKKRKGNFCKLKEGGCATINLWYAYIITLYINVAVIYIIISYKCVESGTDSVCCKVSIQECNFGLNLKHLTADTN